MLKLSETLFVQLLRSTWFLQALPVREPVFTVATCHWDPRLSKRGPIGDPIFSEMGTKWGPSAAEWGPKKQMFSKLIGTS